MGFYFCGIARLAFRLKHPICGVIVPLETSHFLDYNKGMARPTKDPKLRMETDLRIPVTADQKRVISDAVRDEPAGMAAWARSVLLDAARKKRFTKGRIK
jgi:hypothetical protein